MEFKAVDRRLEGKTLLRQCQLTELYLLDVFVEICEQHHLLYFLNYGTLLGAMRHQGFIPWDDDIDVGMPWDDYQKFLKIAPKELPGQLLLQTPQRFPGVEAPFAKLRDTQSFFCEVHTNIVLPCGIYIDIFPMVKFPRLSKENSIHLTNACATSWQSARIHRTLPHGSVLGIWNSGIKAFVWQTINMVSILLVKTLNLLCSSVWKVHPNFGLVPYQGFNEEVVFPLKKHTFEGKEYLIPNDPDAVLTQYYGDWRTPPPPEKQVWHHHSIICPTQAPDAPWATKYTDSKTR